MSAPTIFDVCTPRDDVLAGTITESDFAADLAQVLRGDAPAEYRDPVKFFANTHPTRGLKSLIWNVCSRLNGSSKQVASLFRLDTNYGGGKTHSLIALTHAARGMEGVPNASEFISPEMQIQDNVRIAAFDGENSDPTNGRHLGHGIRAYTPWGEIAYSLNGIEGYELVRRSDHEGVAPGSETIKELFGGEPSLVLIDELSVYLRKLKAKSRERAGGQLTAFLSSLFKAGISLGGLKKDANQNYSLDEDLALNLGLLFRTLAPMRNRENMRMVADGIEAMGKEEAAYWLGMAMHRKYPRRVLMALRFLLIDPKTKLKD